jgi:MFS family permease
VWLYGATNVLGYVLALYTLATYSTAGLGLSQAQGSVLQACLAGGQMVGRPLCGLVLDRFGRINMTALLAWAAGLSCLLVWTFGRTYAVLIFFAIFQG